MNISPCAKTMLTDQQKDFFQENGYLVVEGLLDQARVLAPLVAEYEALLADLRAKYIAEGSLKADAPSRNFQEQISSIYAAGLEYFQPLDISLPAGEILADTPFHAGPAVFDLMTAPALLDVVEDLIGPEITSNPIQHVRIKPPATELAAGEIRAHITATDWHQDRAVTLEEADATRMVTTWVAVTDATADNGCLQVIPKSHRGQMLPHCPLPEVGIPAKLFDQSAAMPLPVGSGGVVFFHPLTIHGSLANRSQGVRWSFDLRYNVTGEPTGRPMFPSFVARSKSAPQSVLNDAGAWKDAWLATRETLSRNATTTIHRWSPDAAHCA
ncbi:MAG: phytanoyl-CoA dioxygenase family protein [Pseudomonadota bacterium]